MDHDSSDPDADLFGHPSSASSASSGATGRKHTFDGTTCPTCDRVHGPLPESISPEQVEKFLDLLDRLPDDVAQSLLENFSTVGELPPESKFLGMFFDGLHSGDHENEQTSLLRAVAETLDSLTDGQVSARFELYEYERQLITNHKVLKICNNALAAASAADANGPTWLMQFACDFLIDRIAVITTRYRKAAAQFGTDVDEQLIVAGVHQAPPKWAQIAMVNYFQHTDHDHDYDD